MSNRIPDIFNTYSELDKKYYCCRFKPKNGDKEHVSTFDATKAFTEGLIVTKEELLKNFNDENPGIRIEGFDPKDPETLKWQRSGRVLASGVAAGLNTITAGFLSVFGGKMIINALKGEDNSDTYRSIGKAFSFSVIPGMANGFALENKFFGIGTVCMSLMSNFIDRPWGLSLFSIFDGLHSLGYFQIRYRREKNALSVSNSIFNSKKLRPLNFLQPIEQSIYHFFNLARNPKKILEEEPYSTCNAAAGGLISAGGILGVLSPLARFVPEKIQALPYTIYSILSSVFLISLFKDGDKILYRANKWRGNPTGQKPTKIVEGFFKKLATPVLGVNNLLLFCKGLGLETNSKTVYDSAMGFRSIGAGLAMIAYGAQSAFNFFKPMYFGPDYKEVIKIFLNPRLAKEVLFKTISERRIDRGYRPYEDTQLGDDVRKEIKSDEIRKRIDNILNDDCLDGGEKGTLGKIYDRLCKTYAFQKQQTYSQAGLPNPSDQYTKDRAKLDRYTHGREVCAVGIILFNEILNEAKKANDNELVKYLKEHEMAFKVGTLLHDVGHGARSHTIEKAVVGHDNDEQTRALVEGFNKKGKQLVPDNYLDLHHTLKDMCGEKVIKQILEIYERESPFFKLMKSADRVQYQLLGDFITIKDPRLTFPAISIDGIREFARENRFYKENGEYKIGYTEDGAIKVLIREYNRLVFDVRCNNSPISFAQADLLYAIGLSEILKHRTNITYESIKYMSEDEVDNLVKEGLDILASSSKDVVFPVEVEQHFGKESYSGYYKLDPKNQIRVVNNDGSTTEITDYVESIIKGRDDTLYNFLKPKITKLTMDVERRPKIYITNDESLFEKVNLRRQDLSASQTHSQSTPTQAL